jgi:hypothetical protein
VVVGCELLDRNIGLATTKSYWPGGWGGKISGWGAGDYKFTRVKIHLYSFGNRKGLGRQRRGIRGGAVA